MTGWKFSAQMRDVQEEYRWRMAGAVEMGTGIMSSLERTVYRWRW